MSYSDDFDNRQILRNRVKCLLCLDVVESTHRHHFARCACGKVFTDGGREYIRRGGDFTAMQDMTVYK